MRRVVLFLLSPSPLSFLWPRAARAVFHPVPDSCNSTHNLPPPSTPHPHRAPAHTGKKDKKLCYFVKTMKKEYAKHLSYKKSELQVCKKMAKQNPEVCEIKYPKKTAGSVSWGFGAGD